jgi:hypothetical protein
MAGVDIWTTDWPVSISWMKKYATDPKQVSRVAHWMKETGHLSTKYCLGTGIVTQSLGFRFLLSSIFLIKPMPCPYQVCKSFAEAFTFVTGEATKHDLALPAVTNPWPI